MRFILIGAGGQDGKFLFKKLSKRGHDVLGLSRGSVDTKSVNIADRFNLQKEIFNFRPDIVINLAAIASTDDKYLSQNYDAMINGSHNLSEISKSSHRFHLINFGSIYQFENSTGPINCETSKRNYNNHYSIFRNAQENILKICSDNFYSVKHYYLCHHESKFSKANNFTTKLMFYLQGILKGTVTEKLEIKKPSTVREWSDAEVITEKLVNTFENKLSSGFSVEIFNNKEGASTYNFIKNFCNYNDVNMDNFFEFGEDQKEYQTDNENFTYSEKTQKWIRSFK